MPCDGGWLPLMDFNKATGFGGGGDDGGNCDGVGMPAAAESSLASTKSPRHKQCYRLQWESMPDFKGWLRGVPNEPTRAYCAYCEKTLHAHRLSLLKHTCTLKHTKAAQSAFSVKNAAKKEGKGVENDESSRAYNQDAKEDSVTDEDDVDDVTPVEDATDGELSDQMKPPPSKVAKMEASVPSTPSVPNPSPFPLSTHVLDTAKGTPVGGLQVSLYKLIDGRWTLVGEGFTSPDGRCSQLVSRKDFTAGRYKLHFDVDRYYELRRQESMYPFIEIVFDVKSPQEHYHVPLLISPYGYTTYRGS